MSAPTEAQIVRAAKKMCALSSEECGVNNDDNWLVYGNSYLAEARIVLEYALAEDQT